MTAVNNENPVSAVRAPRGLVFVQSLNASGPPTQQIRVSGVVNFEVNNNSHYEADTFRLVLALSAQPNDMGFLWWSQQISLQVEIYAGFPSDSVNFTKSSPKMDRLIIGNVDGIEIDPVADEIILCGRDLTALFIDTKTMDSFMNLTSSGVAMQLATKHGLIANVTKTSDKVGGYYKDDFLRVNKERSEWDLLVMLAREEGFLVYVTGNTLNFVPKPTANTANPYVVKWQAPTDTGFSRFNGIRINFSRNLTVARGVVVVVRTMNVKTGKPLVVTYPSSAKGIKPGQSTGPQVYNVTIANGTPASALAYAQNIHKEITQHEVKVHIDMPADNLLTPETMIQVVGTGTAYDQFYYPASVVRHFSPDDGYRMTIEAKNHSSLTEAS